MMEIRIALWLSVLFLLIAFLFGCAELPKCERPEASVFSYEGKNYAMFDDENIVKLGRMLKGLKEGACE